MFERKTGIASEIFTSMGRRTRTAYIRPAKRRFRGGSVQEKSPGSSGRGSEHRIAEDENRAKKPERDSKEGREAVQKDA